MPSSGLCTIDLYPHRDIQIFKKNKFFFKICNFKEQFKKDQRKSETSVVEEGNKKGISDITMRLGRKDGDLEPIGFVSN